MSRAIQAVVLIAAVATMSHASSARTLPKCRPADGRSLALIRELQGWVTTTNADRIASRDTAFHIPVVPAAKIVLVVDERVCARMIRAYGGYPAYTPIKLYVIRLGSKGYVGYDPDRVGGEFTTVYIFDTNFVHIGGWVG